MSWALREEYKLAVAFQGDGKPKAGRGEIEQGLLGTVPSLSGGRRVACRGS